MLIKWPYKPPPLILIKSVQIGVQIIDMLDSITFILAR